jgi:nitroreductase
MPKRNSRSNFMPDKPAQTRFPLHQLIRDRWSPVAFDAGRNVEPEKLGSLLEAARWAPSSYNGQPWAYLVATRDQPDEFQKMLGCLVEGNIAWAQHAPVLMIAVARLAFEHNGQPNRHAFHDVGLANENLVLQATALGLIAHQMAGFDPEKARSLYGIPDGWEAATALAVGYPGHIDELPEKLQNRDESPRSRKPLSEMAFSGNWGESLPLPG